MTPYPLTVAITVTTTPAIDYDQATATGRRIGRQVGGDLVLSSSDPDHRTTTWRYALPDSDHTGVLAAATIGATIAVADELPDGVTLDHIEHLSVRTIDDLRRDVDRPVPPLVGIDEACEILDVSRSWFDVIRKRPGFPREAHRNIWLEAAMRRHAEERRAAPHDPAAPQEQQA